MELGNIIEEEEIELFTPSERFLTITQYISLYYTPLLCLFGGFGNCISLYIFCMTSSHRNLSSSYYLSALAISDTGFLINVMALWLTSDLGFNVITTKLTCPLVMFLGQVTCFLSVWFVVAFTVERFFAVCYPLTRPSVCTVARARKVIIGITIVALLAFSYALVIASVIPLSDGQYLENIPDFSNTTDDGVSSASAYDYYNENPTIASNSTTTTAEQLSSSSSTPYPRRSSRPLRLELSSTMSGGESSRLMNEADMAFEDYHEESTGNKSSFTIPNSVSSNSTNDNNTFSTMSSTILVCSVPTRYHTFSRFANYVDSMFTLVLPFFIITYLNVRITMCVWRLKGQRETIVAVKRKSILTSAKCNPGGRGGDNLALMNNAPVAVASSPALAQLSPLSSSSGKEAPVAPDCGEGGSAETAKAKANHNKKSFSCSFVKSKNNVILHNVAETGLSPGTTGSNNASPTANFETGMTDELLHQQQQLQQNGGCAPSKAPDLLNNSNSAYFNNSGGGRLSMKLNNHRLQSGGPTTTTIRRVNHHNTAAEVRVTKTLLLVSTVFLVLNLPSHALRAIAFIQQAFWPESNHATHFISALHQWAYMLFNTNFGVNFLLYCVSGRNFRKSLYNLLCCTNRRHQNRRREATGAASITTRILMKKRKASNMSYTRNTSNHHHNHSAGANKKKRTVSLRRRVLKSFTQCPSSLLGLQSHSSRELNNRNKNEINLCRVAQNSIIDEEELVEGGPSTRQYGSGSSGGGGSQGQKRRPTRNPSIQSTTFTTFINEVSITNDDDTYSLTEQQQNLEAQKRN